MHTGYSQCCCLEAERLAGWLASPDGGFDRTTGQIAGSRMHFLVKALQTRGKKIDGHSLT